MRSCGIGWPPRRCPSCRTIIRRDSIDSDVDARSREIPSIPGSGRLRLVLAAGWDGERYHHPVRASPLASAVTSREVTDGNCRTRGVACPSFLEAGDRGERHVAMRRERESEDLIECSTLNEADLGLIRG